MPFLGKQGGECEAAIEVFEDMDSDVGKEVEINDSETNAFENLLFFISNVIASNVIQWFLLGLVKHLIESL